MAVKYKHGVVVVRPSAAAPKSEMATWADQINDRISQLNDYAIRLGNKYGLASTPLLLHSTVTVGTPDSIISDQVTLERHEGNWGLYCHRLVGGVTKQIVPLKDAPLAIRELFLQRAEPFFREYLERIESRLEQVKQSVAGGDAALSFLAMKLEEF